MKKELGIIIAIIIAPLLAATPAVSVTHVYAQQNQRVCYSNGACWDIHGGVACKENTNPLFCINVSGGMGSVG